MLPSGHTLAFVALSRHLCPVYLSHQGVIARPGAQPLAPRWGLGDSRPVCRVH